MTGNESVRPERLERFLSERTDGVTADAEITPEELRPRHVVAVATTTEDGLASLGDDFDWPALLDALSELDDDREARWLVRLIQNLGSRTAAGIESEAGIRAIGDRAYELRHEQPQVFLRFLDELQSLLRYDTSSEGISAAEAEFRRVAGAGDRESDRRVQAFRERDIEQRLVDPNLGADSRISLLETLADEPLEEIPTRLIVDVLYPLRNHYDAEVERAALGTIEAWARALNDRGGAEGTVETLEAYLAGERDEIPSLLLVELILVGYVGPAIIEWLGELPRIEERQAVVVSAFEALQQLPGLRDHGEALCSFILENPHDEATVHAGIDVLERILVGLQPHQNTKNPSQKDHIRQVFFSDEELAVDETIRETLQAIVDDHDRSEEVRAHAARVWLSVRPPEIHDLLWDIDPAAVGRDAVVDAKLAAAAEHRLVEFVDVVDDLWADCADDPDRLSRLVETLDRIESREIVDILLDPAFDHDDSELRETAREALVESGYESEVAREAQRRTIVDRIGTRYDAMSSATDTDREIRDRTGEQLSSEEERKQVRVRSSEATSKNVDNLIEFRSQGATQMLRLAPLFDELKELVREIEQLVATIEQLTAEIREERDEAKRLADEIERVENEIDRKRQELENAKNEKENVEERIYELRNRIIPDIEQEITDCEQEIRRVKAQEPSKRQYGRTDEQKEQYRRDMNQWENALGSLEDDLHALRSKKREAENEKTQLENDLSQLRRDISNLESEISNLESEQQSLSRELDRSIDRIDGYEGRLRTNREQLAEYRAEYERLQQQVDDVVTELNGIRSAAKSTESELSERSERFRSEASSLRSQLKSLADSQAEAMERRDRQAQRVRQLADQLDVDHDDFEDLGERTETEVPEADIEAYESAAAAENEQYRENVTDWRQDSVLRRSVETEAVDDTAPEVADRIVRRVGGDAG